VATERVAGRLRAALFAAYVDKNLAFFDTTRTAEMSVVMDKDVRLAAECFTERLASGLRSLNSSVLGPVLLARASPELCAVTLSLSPVIGVGAMVTLLWMFHICVELMHVCRHCIGTPSPSPISYASWRVR
jgi:hypothetical protein